MALTLDEVHNIKFRMAKRTGYEVLDVDEFVDQVESSFEQLQEENANLKHQLETLQTAEAGEQSNVDASTAKNESAAGAAGAHSGTRQRAEIMTVTTSSEASAAVTRLVQMSTEHAENVVVEAEAEAARIRAEADDSAKQVTNDAATRAERVETEAHANADQLRSQAQQNAEELDQQTENRRTELFSQLEQERDQLADSVGELRTFESEFRQQLTDQLHGYLNALSIDAAEPPAAPQALNMARTGSARSSDLDPTATSGEAVTTGSPDSDGDEDPDVSTSPNGSDPNGSDPHGSDPNGSTAAAMDGAAVSPDYGAGAESDAETARADEATDDPTDSKSKTPRLDALLREDS